MENKLKSTLIIGVSIIITALILGTAFKNRNENLDTISVVGLGTTDFVSDEILWSGSFATKSFDIKEAYNKMISDQKIVADLEYHLEEKKIIHIRIKAPGSAALR